MAATARPARRSCGESRDARTLGGEMQAGQDVCGFEVGKVGQDFGLVQSLNKHFQDVSHPDPKPSNARLPAALTWIESDALV